MDKINSLKNVNFSKTSFSPEVRKYLTAFSLSVGLLLGGNGGYKNEANAGIGVSPTPKNLITSPVYSGFPGNIFNSDSGKSYDIVSKEINFQKFIIFFSFIINIF